MHGNLCQLTANGREEKEDFSPCITPNSLKPAGMLLGLDIPNPTCPECAAGSFITVSPELTYLGLFDLTVEVSEPVSLPGRRRAP